MNRPTFPTSSLRSTARRLLLILGSLIPAFAAPATVLSAQDDAGGDLPIIEPRLTRIMGSDSFQVWQAALSPDGRWVAFSQLANEATASLWIVSSEGGEPRRLVEASGVHDPVWSPDGTRFFYLSRTTSTIMAAPFDTGVGRLSGTPQRITLESAMMNFRLSPDGKLLAYRRWADDPSEGRMVIRVIPSNGGTPRTVGDPADQIGLWAWSADGRYIHYRAQTRDAPSAPQTFRAPVAGGPSEVVTDLPTGPSAPALSYRVVPPQGRSTAGGPTEVQSYDGRPFARLALPDGAEIPGPSPTFTPDGRHLVVVVPNSATPVRVVPVAGGPARQLGEARTMEFPLGWSPDGNDVIFSTPLDGRMAIMRAPVAGGAAREVGPLPDRGRLPQNHWGLPIIFSPDLRYLSYSKPTAGSNERTLIVRPVAGGEERVVTRSLIDAGHGLRGRGGTPHLDGDEFLYLEKRGDEKELRATTPEGPSRLIRSFPLSEGDLPKGVFGTRVAYTTGSVSNGNHSEDHTPILVADGPDGVAKEVANLPGVAAYDDIAWSPDGRWIAATAYADTGDPDNYIRILLVGVGPDGEVTTPARLVYTPIIWAAWALSWLPDGSAVTLTGQSPPDGRFDQWLVPVRDQGRPVALTRDDPDGIGFSVLSPDGQYLAYEAFVERGSSIWLADLGDALKGIGR